MTKILTRMERNEVLSLRGKSRYITCVMGTLWITAKTDIHDMILHEGDHLKIDNLRGICVQAIRDAEFAFG